MLNVCSSPPEADASEADEDPPATSRSRELRRFAAHANDPCMVATAEVLYAAFSAMSDVVIITDITGAIVMANHGVGNFFGPCAQISRGASVWELFPDGLFEREAPITLRARCATGALSARFRHVNAVMGSHRHGLVTVNRLSTTEHDGFVFVVKDSTDLEYEIRTDALTALANRGEFDRRIDEEYARMRRGVGEELSLLFLDVDHFKGFNTRYGHQLGDEVLRRVGALLKETVREVDLAARYGGEEFCIILPGTGKDGALHLAERIRTAIADVRIDTETDGEVGLTVSVGVATHALNDLPAANANAKADSLVKEANAALHVAKRQGRDQVVVA